MATSAVIGRDGELGEIQEFLARAKEGPAALVLSGEAGIGKTILWEEGVAQAESRFGRVLVHRSVEAEAGFAFAGLSDLVAPVLDDVADVLAPPRRRALKVALLLADPGAEPPDPRAIGLAFLDMLRALAERGPVLVALDDLQWLDASSASVIPVALRRLCTERVSMLATLREGPGVRASFTPDDAFGEGTLRRLSLAPLDLAALHRLLREHLALELPRPELARVHEISAGNPFFALELGRARLGGTGRAAAGTAMPVPASLRELLGGRLARLPAQTLDVLVDVAALARPTLVLIRAADDGSQRALDALHVAVRAGVVTLDGSRVRFAHPLLASLCYEQASPGTREAVHRRLATVVTDVEERARHLALGADGADDAVAVELDAAAQHAAARGATAAAAELTELAAQRTSPEAPQEYRRRRFAAAGQHRLAGDTERASSIYEELLAELSAGLERADVLYALALTHREDLAARVRLCQQALVEATGDDGRSAQILGFLAVSRWFLGDVVAALRDARAGLVRAEMRNDPRLLAVATARVGTIETWALAITPGLLERGVAIEHALDGQLAFHDSPTWHLALRLLENDELDRARAMLQDFEAAAVEGGDEDTHQWAVMLLVNLEWYAGRWERSLQHGAMARELAEQSQELQFSAVTARFRAHVETDLGLIDQARRTANEALRLARSISDEIFTIGSLAALGRIELAVGDLEAAAGHLRDLPDRLLLTGHYHPGFGPWADTIETLIGLGELDPARVYLTQYEALARRASKWARASAARCRGLLAAAVGDATAAVEAFELALAEDDAGTYPFERARTLLALGALRRHERQSRAAREALEEALAIFERLGAQLWAEKARAELARISGRRPPSDELTETERRVAALAAEGRHNKEIAAELFIGVGTVEAHLSRIYRKLGVRSRTELAGRFAKLGEPAPKM